MHVYQSPQLLVQNLPAQRFEGKIFQGKENLTKKEIPLLSNPTNSIEGHVCHVVIDTTVISFTTIQFEL